MNKTTYQQGSSAVLVLVILVVLAALAFGGWYIWQNNKDDATNTNNSTQEKSQDQNAQANEQEVQVAPEGWIKYENNEAGFSFYYPPEWGKVEKGETRYKFTAFTDVSFDVKSRSSQDGYVELGDMESVVRDVFIENGKPVVRLVQGFHEVRSFTSDQIVKRLSENRICLTDELRVKEYISDPQAVNNIVYFGYCGLASKQYGAFTLSSETLNLTQSKTNRLEEDITKLLQTFEIF